MFNEPVIPNTLNYSVFVISCSLEQNLPLAVHLLVHSTSVYRHFFIWSSSVPTVTVDLQPEFVHLTRRDSDWHLNVY